MTLDEPVTLPDGRLIETPEQRAKRHRRSRRGVAVAIVTAVLGVAMAAYSIVGVRQQVSENKRDADETAASQLETCQTGNRTRPQLQINTLVINDAVLQRAGADITQRRTFARSEVEALSPELAIGRSIGFRDCDGDGRIDRGDFLPTEAPPSGWEDGVPNLLGPDQLPHIPQP